MIQVSFFVESLILDSRITLSPVAAAAIAMNASYTNADSLINDPCVLTILTLSHH